MKDRCPNCGYCEHCGQAKPVYPRPYYPYPYHPHPYWYGGSWGVQSQPAIKYGTVSSQSLKAGSVTSNSLDH